MAISASPCRPPVKGGSEPASINEASGGVVLHFCQAGFYSRADGFELFADFRIGKGGSCSVVGLRTGSEVAVAVQLDDQAKAGAIEVRDVAPEWFLPGELVRQVSARSSRRRFETQVVRHDVTVADTGNNASHSDSLTAKPTPRSPGAARKPDA